MDNIQVLSPQALIVDSIQTVYLRGVSGSAGSIMQVFFNCKLYLSLFIDFFFHNIAL